MNQPDANSVEPDAYHVLAPSGVTDDRSRVLKHDETFAVFDHYGFFKPGGLGEEGLYHEGTRYLSCLILALDGRRPFFLGSTVRDENDQVAVALTNPDEFEAGSVKMPLGTLHLAVKVFLWRAVCHWQCRIKNHGLTPVTSTLQMHFRSDFADIFEVRGMKRKARGRSLPPDISKGRVVLTYVGLDAEKRRTLLRFDPAPAALSANSARFELNLQPGDEITLEVATACWRGEHAPEPADYDSARLEAEAALDAYKASTSRMVATDRYFDAWIRRAESDLHMMTSNLPTGPYPYAGVPWFNTPFGRDGIITALECLWLRPELARGVLSYLASTQATEHIAEQDAEPGKILHETRKGEMAVLKEMPFGRYYGSADATPLFALLAGAYFERSADRDFAATIWPNVEAALNWVDRFGDRDGDGFVEYGRRAADGLVHQGWKDSDDAVFHADGSPAHAPIALCEVQGYVFAAKRAAAMLASALGHWKRAQELNEQAEQLREQFESAFWCEELGTYALALDGNKRRCDVRTSNAGHCLFSGIAAPERAARVAQGLLSSQMFSGWGVRTLSSLEARYNPMSYHNGTVWPHDNALIAYGCCRYGLQSLAVQILTGMFDAGVRFDLYRMPELFCGFTRDPAEGPVSYPVACAPQAWSAASVFMLIQACLGMTVNACDSQVCFDHPRLPAFLGELRIVNLRVGQALLDLRLVPHGEETGVRVENRRGAVDVIAVK